MAEIPLGLLGFAAGAMGAGSPSPHPMGFGQALSGGLLSGLNAYGQMQGVQNDTAQRQMQQMQLMQQMQAQAKAQEREAAQQEYLNQYASTLPPEQQALARIAPDALIEAQVENQFRVPEPPKTRTRSLGGMEITEEWNPQTLGWTKIGEAPRWAPQQPREPKIFGSASTGYYTFGEGGKPEQLIPAASKGGGISFTTPDGSVIQIGGDGNAGPGATPLTTAQASRTQDEISTLIERQARVANIGQYWKPEFQQLGTRMGAAWTAGKERLGLEVPPEDQALLADFTNAKASALADLNMTLQELSGAAVTESEAKRFQGQLPSPGTGIFDGDSPTQFEAKLTARQRELRLALARKSYLLRNGIPHDIGEGDTGGLSIDDIPALIDKRGAELEAQMAAEGLTGEAAQARVDAALREEFGL